MTKHRLLTLSDRWFRLLLRCYPRDFRDEMGDAVVQVYSDRAVDLWRLRGLLGLLGLWIRAMADSLRNGLAERIRPAGAWRRGNWGRDLELARRHLMRSPVFLMATLGTLSVGLGAFAVVYTAVDKVLLEPMPYRDSNDLYMVWRDQSAATGLNRDWLAGPDVADLQKAGGAIQAAVGTQLASPTLSLRPGAEPLQILMLLSSPNIFDFLGVAPMLGRGFAPTEVGPNRPAVIVLSHALWKRLGGDPAIVGSQVWLSGGPYTVIGVTGPTFRFVRHATAGSPQEPDVYMPFRFTLADQNPDVASFAALMRVRHGTSAEQAAAAVAAVARTVDARHPQPRPARLYPVRLRDDLIAPVRPILVTLAGAGALLLLVLCVNLSSLLLARAAGREREFAVSRALGANGSAIFRAMLLEGVALGLVGSVAGAALGWWGSRALVALAPADLPRRGEIALDWPVAMVVIAVGGFLGFVAACGPAAWASRAALTSLVASSNVRGVGATQRLRRGIVVAQVALTVVLLTTAGLVARSLQQLLAADPGFRSSGVLTFTVAMGPRLFPKPADALVFQDRVTAAVGALPTVRSVSASTALPLSASAEPATIRFPGAPGNSGDPQRDDVLADVVAVRASYVESLGMHLVAGRAFETARPRDTVEALIDQRLATRFFPNGTPVGGTISVNGKPLRVIGAVNQARLYSLYEDGRPQVLVRAEDWTPFAPYFVARVDGHPQALVPEVRRVIRQIDPRIPVSAFRSMDELVMDAQRQHRLSAVLTGGFALGAVLLVSMGLFGMVAGSIVRRSGELALRIVLGASYRRVLNSVFGEGALLVALGVLVAIPGVYAAGGLVRGMLVGVPPWDPITLVGVALGMALVTWLACYVPARRVLAIDPAAVLRKE